MKKLLLILLCLPFIGFGQKVDNLKVYLDCSWRCDDDFLQREMLYIDFYQDNLIVLSSRGILAYSNDLENELNLNWEVLTEAVQTLMRYEGIPDAYEQLKKLSRGSKITQESYVSFINNLNISDVSKQKLISLKPSTYIGISRSLSK